jgi:hypothetical protein
VAHLTVIKREFKPEEIIPDLWRARAAEAGVPLETFYEVAEDMNRRSNHRTLFRRSSNTSSR